MGGCGLMKIFIEISSKAVSIPSITPIGNLNPGRTGKLYFCLPYAAVLAELLNPHLHARTWGEIYGKSQKYSYLLKPRFRARLALTLNNRNRKIRWEIIRFGIKYECRLKTYGTGVIRDVKYSYLDENFKQRIGGGGEEPLVRGEIIVYFT